MRFAKKCGMMRKGRARERDLRDYHIFQAHEMPELDTIFVETFEPSHPFGVKAVAEIPMDGVAPAVGQCHLGCLRGQCERESRHTREGLASSGGLSSA
jgi:hypothetical protein